MIGRRGFLSLVGLAPVAAASVAQKLAGLGEGVAAVLGSAELHAGVSEHYGKPIGCAETGYGRGQTLSPDMMAKAYLAINPVPDFVVDRLRDESRAIYRLDPDLASNRSFSLSTKLSVQRQREIARAIDKTKRLAHRNLAKEAFRELNGFDMW